MAIALRHSAKYRIKITAILFGQIVGRVIDEYSSVRNDDCARADGIDFLEDVRRYHDEFFLGH